MQAEMIKPLAEGQYAGPGRMTKFAWVVANVNLDLTWHDNLVHCGIVAGPLKLAKRIAREKAESLLQCYNDERQYKGLSPIDFNEAWEEVDHDDAIEHEYGYDPINSDVSCAAIRVFRCLLANEVKEVKLQW